MSTCAHKAQIYDFYVKSIKLQNSNFTNFPVKMTSRQFENLILQVFSWKQLLDLKFTRFSVKMCMLTEFQSLLAQKLMKLLSNCAYFMGNKLIYHHFDIKTCNLTEFWLIFSVQLMKFSSNYVHLRRQNNRLDYFDYSEK